MVKVRSVWTSMPIAPDGILPASEWSGAGNMPIPAGFLMVKNDADSLYVALDIIGDTTEDIKPGITGDYFWFVIDSDNDGAVTPNRDVLYSAWPGQGNRLGLWVMAGPNCTWPASTGQVLASSLRYGFGPSLNSPVNHRRWEIRFKLSELGIALDPHGQPPVLRFGLRVVSKTPLFTYDYPANPMSAFNNFHQIILATGPQNTGIYPPGTEGAVIGTVGRIPATKIDEFGYATIKSTETIYRIYPDEAAFGGLIDLIGNSANLQKLWNLLKNPARKYKVLRRSGNVATDATPTQWTTWAPIRQSWGNFRWIGTTYIWESFGPDSNDMYPLVDPQIEYSIKKLLFQWNSSQEPNGLHQFKIEFYDDNNKIVTSPVQAPLTLRLDNKAPDVKLIRILHNGAEIPACAIKTMADAKDGVVLEFKAYDAEGAILSYALTTEWGAGEGDPNIKKDDYSNPANRNAKHIWTGNAGELSNKWVPPVTCAYLFRISAYDRTTDGYTYPLRWVTDWRTATLIKPGPYVVVKPAVAVSQVFPYGFDIQKKTIEPGVEPKKLGLETLSK